MCLRTKTTMPPTMTPTMTPRHDNEELEEDDPRYDDADISTAPFTSHTAYGRGLWKNPLPLFLLRQNPKLHLRQR